MRRILRSALVIVACGMVFSGFVGRSVRAEDSSFKLQVLPLECQFNIIDVGTNEIEYLTPEACGQGSNPTTPTDNPGSGASETPTKTTTNGSSDNSSSLEVVTPSEDGSGQGIAAPGERASDAKFKLIGLTQPKETTDHITLSVTILSGGITLTLLGLALDSVLFGSRGTRHIAAFIAGLLRRSP